MYSEIPQGSTVEIQGLPCHIPPEGYVWNIVTKQLEYRGVFRRSDKPEEQYWERFPLPSWYKSVIKAEDEYEKKKKPGDAEFYDERYEKFKQQEWDRRLNGFWIMIRGKSVYLVGPHYLYLQWFSIDVGYPKFRVPDLEYFYFGQYCIEDPESMGWIEITKRRFGKTFRAGLFLIEYVTRTKMTNAGIQSKTGGDAKKVFSKAVVAPFKKLPKFFRPEYDMSLGITPKTEMRFQQTNIRGKKAEEGLDKDELGSMIDHQSADVVAYDGQKLHRYVADECGKCFGKGTKIRMYDGSVKNVEDVVEGDLVMGDDSTQRNVFGVTSGEEQMYRVIPKKGIEWECNKSHILSLKWCLGRDNKKRGFKAKEVVNISVEKYLELTDWEKKHLMLYKNPLNYDAKNHQLEPYFLGLWLGDGSKYNPEITTADSEVVEYLKDLADREGLEFSNPEHIQYRLSCKRSVNLSGSINGVEYKFDSCVSASKHFGYVGDFAKSNIFKKNNWEVVKNTKNRLLTAMQEYNIICNKHIPKEFLIDSRENRLQLLAGLIDSDGHVSKGSKNKLPKSIEITQKIRELAYQIQELATGLGFYSSVNPKVATMRRSDKSMYTCMVYKVLIYGDLWNIPTKVARKKIPIIDFHKNRRTAAHSGFEIKAVGLGKYFGFAVDGNHLFLLEDGTVVHNTTEVNIYDRHDVIRYCLLDDEGRIIGKALYTTTVEKLDSEKDGVQEAFKNLWNDSNQLDRKENGRTASGLYRFFMTADRGRNFDIYGEPDVEKTVKEILADRKSVAHNLRALSARIRKEARTVEEAFSTDSDKCIFNVMNLDGRGRELRERPIVKRYLLFERQLDQTIKWRDVDPKNTNFYWKITALPPPGQANKFLTNTGIRRPGRISDGGIAIDGYSNSQGGKYGSKASAWIGRRFDILDPLNTGKAIGHLYGRPAIKEMLHEQVMMAAEYYGYLAWYEHNSDDYLSYFRERGKIGYLGTYPLSTIDPIKRKDADRYRGFPTTPFSLTKQVDTGIAYVENYSHLIDFEELIEDLKKFDPNNRTEFDISVSWLMLLVVLMEPIRVPEKVKEPLVNTYENPLYGRSSMN